MEVTKVDVGATTAEVAEDAWMDELEATEEAAELEELELEPDVLSHKKSVFSAGIQCGVHNPKDAGIWLDLLDRHGVGSRLEDGTGT